MKVNFRGNNINTININTPWLPVDAGPLTETITIPRSKKFKELIDFVCKLTDRDISELGHRYLVEGVSRDIKDIFSVEPYLDKRLREILTRR